VEAISFPATSKAVAGMNPRPQIHDDPQKPRAIAVVEMASVVIKAVAEKVCAAFALLFEHERFNHDGPFHRVWTANI
jgi:hypothetical protein